LAAHGPGVVAELERRGYAAATIGDQMKVLGSMSRWMAAEALVAKDLSPEVVERYVAWRRARGYGYVRSSVVLRPLLAYLRATGVLVAVDLPAAGPVDVLLERYRGYLVQERVWPRRRCAVMCRSRGGSWSHTSQSLVSWIWAS
jgi:hypothetical protein